MSHFVEITDSNGKTKRTRYLNPVHISCVDASGSEHSLVHFVNGKSMELNLAAKKIIALLDRTPEGVPVHAEHE